MVMTKAELLAALQHEIHILQHLASKVDPSMLDYRPTAKQRSTLELFRYLSFMGPEILKSIERGNFDASWSAAESAAKALTFEQALSAIGAQREIYSQLLADVTEEQLRSEIAMIGRTATRGAFLVNFLLGHHVAYRTQLFLYLKACGREELSTMNLWAGADPPPAS
jgi:hypothetical protein